MRDSSATIGARCSVIRSIAAIGDSFSVSNDSSDMVNSSGKTTKSAR
jgi:hypothetical protein